MSLKHRTQDCAGRRTLVLLDSDSATRLPGHTAALEKVSTVRIVDYSRLMGYTEELRRVVREHGINFVLFSRNDQVYDRVSIGPLVRALGTGYSSFSGIDTEHAASQLEACLDDYLSAGSATVEFGSRQAAKREITASKGSFSLIFDLEQLGGARFGLPRLLDLLDVYSAKATFFTTNFVPETYRNVLSTIRERGHEVGLHGLYHERLSGRSFDEQAGLIEAMKRDFEASVPVQGANFIGRMDGLTIDAMIKNRLRYFVAFLEHKYGLFSYRSMPLRPMLVWSPRGAIWMVPVSVETNNRPWINIRNTVDAAIAAGKAQGRHHVNVLLHPFRDGSLRHISSVERLLDYMQSRHSYDGVSAGKSLEALCPYKPSTLIYYQPPDVWPSNSPGRFPSSRWSSAALYMQRIGFVYETLESQGRLPALCTHVPDTWEGEVYAIYPNFPAGIDSDRKVEKDPLVLGADGLVCEQSATGRRVTTLEKGGAWQDLVGVVQSARPQRRQDYTGLFPEVAMRVAYRLSSGRHIF